jgi:hypothetical protein
MARVSSHAIQHLALRLRPLNRALRAAVERQAKLAARLLRPDVTPLCVTDEQVKILLGDIDQILERGAAAAPAALTAEETDREEALRAAYADEGLALPLDRLAQSLDLSAFEEEAVLLCAASEIDRSYERIYAYVLDDLNRRQPCIELLAGLTATTLDEKLARRKLLGRYGKLRRKGILRATNEVPSELRQELHLAQGVLDFLIGGAPGWANEFRDRAEVPFADFALPPGLDRPAVERLAAGLRDASLGSVGVWGPPRSPHEEAVLGIARAAGKPVRRFPAAEHAPSEVLAGLDEALRASAALDAALWIDTDPLAEPGYESLRRAGATLLAASAVPVLLAGTRPWRPAALLESRGYAEIELHPPDFGVRRALWCSAMPEGDGHDLADLAARYRMSGRDIRIAARTARTRARLSTNGHASDLRAHLEAACAAVTRPSSQHFSSLVEPRRRPADLILPQDLHAQVLEVAEFFRAWPRVVESWGFGRRETSADGLKVLFTGDSGTGKTLAAEVIAGQLNMPLLKVDLARIVSKWVGETEKNLESAFREAEDGQAVLFFDEADALFGRRGEVLHGVDRYANLEVSFLLQRLEDYGGLVILASNLKDNIDLAFTRRFQVVLHFPRPQPGERARIWKIAFPPGAPLDEDVDLGVLSRLDLTGAGIMAAARTSALIAACEGSRTISKQHLVYAIARQYKREARVMMASELGPYAALLPGMR